MGREHCIYLRISVCLMVARNLWKSPGMQNKSHVAKETEKKNYNWKGLQTGARFCLNLSFIRVQTTGSQFCEITKQNVSHSKYYFMYHNKKSKYKYESRKSLSP